MLINGFFFEKFPNELKLNSISLIDYNIDTVIWKKEFIIKFLFFLFNNNYAILGGDVYDDNLKITYDNWFIKRDSSSDWRDYVELSYIKSIKYITDFYLKNGDNYYYSVEFVDEINYNFLNWQYIKFYKVIY